jgi:PadR family transcriptional regulator, regulatory protein AphA
MKSNKTRFTILGMLSIRPMSGYEIKKEISTSTKHFWAESDGQLYPTLAKLKSEGLIKTVEAKKSEVKNKRLKQTYRITAEGEETLKTWLFKEPNKVTIRNELLLKLYFGANVANDQSVEQLEAFRQKIKSLILQYNDAIKDAKKEHADSSHLPFRLMTLDYGKCISKAQLEWCETQIKALATAK